MSELSWERELEREEVIGSGTPATAESTTIVEKRTSVALQKFQACRWRRPAEGGDPECCGHRDVLPLTGTHGFDPEAWCEDCQFFKLRRIPRKSPGAFTR